MMDFSSTLGFNMNKMDTGENFASDGIINRSTHHNSLNRDKSSR
jgi:hypothetical protein